MSSANKSKMNTQIKVSKQPKTPEPKLPSVKSNDSNNLQNDSKKVIRKAKYRFDTSFRSLQKSLRNTNVKFQLGGNTPTILNNLLGTFVRRMVNDSKQICEINKRKTISEKELEVSLRNLFPFETFNELHVFATQAIHSFRQFEKQNDKSVRREVRADLHFSVSLMENYLKETPAFTSKTDENRKHRSMYYVSAMAPVYLAAVTECFCKTLLTHASQTANEMKHIQITPRYLYLSIHKNNDLLTVANNLNLMFLGMGIVPEKLPFKKSNAEKEVLTYQKGTGFCIHYNPFKKLVKNIANGIAPDSKLQFGKNFLIAVQHYVESLSINILNSSRNILEHTKTLGISDTVFLLARNLQTSTDLLTAPESVSSFIRKNDIKRLCRRAGIKSIRASVYEAVRNDLYTNLYSVLEKSLNITRYRNKSTIMFDDLDYALRLDNVNILVNFFVPKIESASKPQTGTQPSKTPNTQPKKENPPKTSNPAKSKKTNPQKTQKNQKKN